ncbi:MAG: DUF4162 domain-containing protein, partial [Bacteroidales bacterium]|nr:DUF4162 domain-containing protein [Bacteroidales bacterium]
AQIRQEYKSGEYALGFKGDGAALATTLNEHGCTVSGGTSGTINIHAPEKSGNQLLELAISCVEVHSFNEILPGMNDIFIRKVTEK